MHRTAIYGCDDTRCCIIYLSFSNAWRNRWSCLGIRRKFPLRQYAMEGISKRRLAKFQWTGSICGCGPSWPCSMIKTHLKHSLFSNDPYSNHSLWTNGNFSQGNETKGDGDRTSGQRHLKCNICRKKSTGFRLTLRIAVNYHVESCIETSAYIDTHGEGWLTAETCCPVHPSLIRSFLWKKLQTFVYGGARRCSGFL